MSLSDLTIIEMYKSGKSYKSISVDTGISASQIGRIIRSSGISIRSTKTSSSDEAIIIEMYNQGVSSENIAKELSIDSSTVCRILSRNNIEIKGAKHYNRKFELDEHILDIIDTEEKAYFLGFMYSDGYVSPKGYIRIVIHKKDIDIIKKFVKMFYGNEEADIGSNFQEYDNKYIRFTITSSYLTKKIIEHGCFESKTFKLSLPNLPEHLMNHFLRGLYDGDGCISIDNVETRSRVILTGFKDFIEQIKLYLETGLEISPTIYILKKNNKVADLVVGCQKDIVIFLDWLYKGATIYLNRKYKKQKDVIDFCEDHLSPSFHYGSTNIISYNGEKLTSKYILSLSDEEKKKVSLYVFAVLRENGFPYENFDFKDLENDFSNLKEVSYSLDGKNLICGSNAGLNIFKNYCHHYFQVRSKKQVSMLEAFNDDELLMKVIQNRMGITYKETFNITGNMIRQGMRNSYSAFAASIFKPVVAKVIYEIFAPSGGLVYDSSAGFGQRLVGACASGKNLRYIGVDPWEANVIALNKIINDFKFSAEVIRSGSEEFCPKELEGAVDFSFSSPPYFDKEIYCDHASQAYMGVDFDNFISKWWRCTIVNIWKLLKVGGLFVLNMDDHIGIDMIESCRDIFVLEDTLKILYKREHLGSDSSSSFFVLRKL